MKFLRYFLPTGGWKMGAVILLAMLTSCVSSSNPDVQRGSNYLYKPGYPEVRFNAVGFLDESNQPRIHVTADIVYSSMVFKEIKGKQQAKLSIDLRVVNSENSNKIINSKHKDVTVTRQDDRIITSQNSYVYQDEFDVSPGSYKVYLTVTDKSSDKKITRSSETSIPDPENNQIDLTDIRMLAKDMDSENPKWVPVTTYDVPGRIDSLMFMLQVTNNASDQPLTVNAKLIQFEADSTHARPMFYNNYSPSSIEYQGIDLDETTTIQQSQRKLQQQGSVFVEYRFAQQDRGNYRFEVRSNKDENDLFKARDFSVKSKNYPAIKTPRELARPLVYLMKDKNYEKMIKIQDQDSLKAAIDRFWLKQIGDKNKALNTLKMYYQRVEEANKQFSNFEEGWKTDAGMMYVLFGPPWYVEQHLDQMEWSYSYNRSDPDRNFYFFQPKLNNKYYPFDHFILRRDQSYFNVEYQQRQLWLTGLILQRSI